MMDWFWLFMAAMFIGPPIGMVANNWIRAKHGYPLLENEWGGKVERSKTTETAELKAENARLVERLEASEDRIAVLERIVTDKAYSVSAQIDALRDPPRLESHSEKEPN